MLKNAGATYQRLVNHMFRPQIGQNVEVYVDDMLVKSHDERKHVDDLEETLDTLRQYNMKLNPNKCAFGVSSGKFLGFMVSYRRIKANPDKIQAILDMDQRISKKSNLLLDESLPLTSLSLKLLTSAYHFLRFLGRHLNRQTSVKRPFKTSRPTSQ